MAVIKPKPRLGPDELWEFAVRSLARRAQSTGEIRRKLLAKAESAAGVDAAIARLREHGYLNDRRFAENFAGARLENQGVGRTRVLRELRERKLSAPVAERAVAQAYEGVDESELIAAYIRRRIRTPIRGEKELASAYRKLIRAGFRPSNAIRALKSAAAEPEALDGFEPPEEDPGESA
jgi:regulatory protein